MKYGKSLLIALAFSIGASTLSFADPAEGRGSEVVALGYRIMDIISNQPGYGYDSKLDACLEAALSKQIHKCATGAATTLTFSNIHCSYSNAVSGPHYCSISTPSDPDNFISVRGPKAQALYSAMESAGFQGEGAAGTIHAGGSAVKLTFDIPSFDGGSGALVNYDTDYVSH